MITNWSITDIFNKTNLKRLAYWLIDNKLYTAIIFFVIISTSFRFSKYNIKNPKNKIRNLEMVEFQGMQEDGALKFRYKNSDFSIMMKSFSLPYFSNQILSKNDKCSSYLFKIFSSKINKELAGASVINIKNAENGIMANSTSYAEVEYDKNSLSKFILDNKLYCSSKGENTKSCNWCEIYNIYVE